MKKLLAIIAALLIIFIGMLIYKNNKTNSNITINEINKIEEYISKIYMWKEVTISALPTFNNINEASDLWVWEVIKKNLEEYEVTYEQIENKEKELFGKEITKEFPKEGNEYFEYNLENGKYYATEIDLDDKNDKFLLNEIKRIEKGYEVEIVEYLEDYSKNEGNILIENLKQEEIENIREENFDSKEIVKNNIDKFTKKKIYLKTEDENLIVEKVE